MIGPVSHYPFLFFLPFSPQSFPPSFLIFFFVCGVYVCAYGGIGQGLLLAVFLCCSLLYFIRQGLTDPVVHRFGHVVVSEPLDILCLHHLSPSA